MARALGSIVRSLLCALCVLFAHGVAAAQDAQPPAKYQELVDFGLSESAAGRFAEARAAFRQAHALYPNARTLRVIGMVAFELRDYVDAVRHLEPALTERRRALDAEQRAQVSKLLEQCRGYIARYSTSELPAGTTLLVDARPATLEAGGLLYLTIGEHKVVAKHDGRTTETVITVRGGESSPLPIVLESAQPAPVAAAPLAQPAPAPDTVPDEINRDVFADDPADTEPASQAKSDFPLGPVLTIGAGVVVAAVGAVLLVSGMSDIDDVENADPGTEWSSLQSSYDGSALLTGLGAGLLAAGGVTAAVGVTWLATDGGGGESAGIALQVRGGGTW